MGKSKGLKMLDVFVFTHELPGIEQIRFEQLRAGDIFYCEEPDGTLVVDESSDCAVAFIYIALSDPIPSVTPAGVAVRVEPVMAWEA